MAVGLLKQHTDQEGCSVSIFREKDKYFKLLRNQLKSFKLINQPTNQPDAATSQVYCLSFKYSSTCFWHPHAHHQELQLQ
jgi:hypothetical protein